MSLTKKTIICDSLVIRKIGNLAYLRRYIYIYKKMLERFNKSKGKPFNSPHIGHFKLSSKKKFYN